MLKPEQGNVAGVAKLGGQAERFLRRPLFLLRRKLDGSMRSCEEGGILGKAPVAGKMAWACKSQHSGVCSRRWQVLG